MVAEEFYKRPIPTGRLPYDLPTQLYVEVAEKQISHMSCEQHIACHDLKLRLLPVLSTKITNEPIYALFQVRTLLEAHLHRFVNAKLKGERQLLMEPF